jgi:hypothetical protein
LEYEKLGFGCVGGSFLLCPKMDSKMGFLVHFTKRKTFFPQNDRLDELNNFTEGTKTRKINLIPQNCEKPNLGVFWDHFFAKI